MTDCFRRLLNPSYRTLPQTIQEEHDEPEEVSPQTAIELEQSTEVDYSYDPMEHSYQVLSVGEGKFTQNIDEDMAILREYGFIIEYPNGNIGHRLYGDVFRGTYGPNV